MNDDITRKNIVSLWLVTLVMEYLNCSVPESSWKIISKPLSDIILTFYIEKLEDKIKEPIKEPSEEPLPMETEEEDPKEEPIKEIKEVTWEPALIIGYKLLVTENPFDNSFR